MTHKQKMAVAQLIYIAALAAGLALLRVLY